MTAPIFLLFAAIAVLCAINLVVQTHPIASALSLIGVMGSLAILYLQLGGEFIAMAQIIVYAGAVMVLFIFVIMLLNAGAEPPTFQVSRFVRYFGAILLAAFLGLISFIIQGALPRTEGVIFGTFQGTTVDVGRKLFTSYLLPFEVVSILILIAIVGAIVLARKEV
jgi:NADH-quinone oxidoreductase subunit J